MSTSWSIEIKGAKGGRVLFLSTHNLFDNWILWYKKFPTPGLQMFHTQFMYKGYLRAPLKRQFNLMWTKTYLLISEQNFFTLIYWGNFSLRGFKRILSHFSQKFTRKSCKEIISCNCTIVNVLYRTTKTASVHIKQGATTFSSAREGPRHIVSNVTLWNI